jgi:hypothetical protein
MKVNKHLWYYVAELFLEWEVFQTKVIEKIKTRVMFSTFFSENRSFFGVMWKNMVEHIGQRWQYNKAYGPCILDKYSKNTDIFTHTHTQYLVRIAS